MLHALYLQLHLLDGEAGVDEKHGVLLLARLRTGEERGVGALHASADRHAALGLDVDVDEGLDKARGLLLQLRIALDVRVAVGYAVLQGLDLGIHANLCGGQSWNSHLHFYEFNAALLLGNGSHLLHFAYGGFGKILYAKLGNKGVDDLFFNRCRFHCLDVF